MANQVLVRSRVPLVLGLLALCPSFPSGAQASDSCGQQPGGSSLSKSLEEATNARDKFCGGGGDLGALAEQCKAGDGDPSVTEDARGFRERAEKLCESSAKAIQQAQGACAAHKKASAQAEKFKSEVAAMKGADGRELASNHGSGSSQISQELARAADASHKAGEKVGEEAKSANEAKEDLGRIDKSAPAQDKLRAEQVGQAEQEWHSCPNKTCDAQAKGKWQQARQKQSQVKAACRDLLAAKRKMEEARKALQEKLEGLQKSAEGLAKEAQDKAASLKGNSATDGDRVGKLKTMGADAAGLGKPAGEQPTITGDPKGDLSGDPEAKLKELSQLPKDERKKQFAETVEPFAREAAEKMVPSDVKDREAKVDEATKAITAHWAYETDYCSNLGCQQRNNLAGLANSKGTFGSFQEFATKGGNPMTIRPSREGHAGYVGYLTPGKGWSAYSNAAEGLQTGNTDMFYRRISDGGFSSICKGSCYYNEVSTRYRDIYGYSPPSSASGRSIARDFLEGAPSGAGPGARASGYHASSAARPSHGSASPASGSMSLRGDLYASIPAQRSGKFNSTHLASNEAAQRNAASIGALVWEEPADGSKISLELVGTLQEGGTPSVQGEAARASQEPRQAGVVEAPAAAPELLLSQQAASGEPARQIASVEEDLFQRVRSRYRSLERIQAVR